MMLKELSYIEDDSFITIINEYVSLSYYFCVDCAAMLLHVTHNSTCDILKWQLCDTVIFLIQHQPTAIM
jgi:hypothetical protein